MHLLEFSLPIQVAFGLPEDLPGQSHQIPFVETRPLNPSMGGPYKRVHTKGSVPTQVRFHTGCTPRHTNHCQPRGITDPREPSDRRRLEERGDGI